MSALWKVLVVDDNPAEFALIEAALEGSGRLGACRRVPTCEGIQEASLQGAWDVVLCAYHASQADIMDRARFIQASLPDVPVILISDGFALEVAVDLLKAGVADLVLTDGLARLAPSIERSLAEASARASRKRVEEVCAREAQLLLQRNALITLTGSARSNPGDLASALHPITEIAAGTIGVARVSIWRYNAGHTGIQCLDFFDAGAGQHAAGMELAAADYPVYFTALLDRHLIAADEARTDPLTREFSRDYLPAHGITSMLDVPIHLGGTLYGVLCHEHVGPVRHWSTDEKIFAVALANLVSLALEERERRQAEEQLRLHSAALQAAHNGIVITNREGTINWANPAFAAISGYTFEEVAGRNPRELLRSGLHDTEFFKALWETILAGQVWHGTIINQRKDGSLYTESQRISPIRDSDGEITHFVAIKEDVTEKLQTEATLRSARERLQRAVQAGNIALWEWDLRSGTADYSPEWMEQAGREPGSTAATIEAWYTCVHPDDVDPLRQALADCVNEPRKRFQREFRFCRPDGEVRWILLVAAAEVDGGGHPSRVIGTNIDITDRKRLESEFQQAQKMESIGRLAGGVAHDFNNLMGVIGGYTELALEALDEHEAPRESLVQIKRAADRATGLTRQLLAFSRRQILRPAVADLNSIIVDAEKMLRRLIGEDVELSVDLDPGLSPVLADPGQIDQILMNLAVNARDAMPMGGRLTISTRNEVMDQRQALRRAGGRPGTYACIVFQDSGVGMDRQTQARIFEPFFTTKETGKGTGLGLATVYGIVKQSGGNIWVDSEPGQGSAFRIYLPHINATADRELPAALPEGMLPGTETILLAEDEEALRSVMRTTLSRAGYTVLAAEDGHRAIALMDDHAGEVHLILTDVVMPGLSGPEIVGHLMGRRPGIKALFMSGYADDTILHHGVLDRDIEFINKPFTFAQLNRKVREVLDKP